MNTSSFDPSASLLAGMDEATLRAWLTQAQTAYMQLSTGGKVASASYSTADGAQSVSYTRAELPAIAQLIRLIQAQLGIGRGRRPIFVNFR